MDSINRKTLKQGLVIFALFLLVCSTAIFWGTTNKNNEPIYIAFAGPLSGANEFDGDSVVKGAQLAIDRINESGGVNNKKLKLLSFDDRGEAKIAVSKAKEIANETAAVAVLGHIFSTSSIAAGRIYRKEGIPAIASTASADAVTIDNPWYFRSFSPTRVQGNFLAYYLREIRERDRIAVVYDSQDIYSKSLTDVFSNTFENIGGEVKQWDIGQHRDNFQSFIQTLLRDLKVHREEFDTLFLPIHISDYFKITVPLKRNHLDYKIIGSDSLTNIITTSKEFKNFPEEQAKPGYFLEDVLAPSPLIFDVAGRQAQQFRNDYRSKYKLEPGWVSANAYDAVQILARAMEQSGIQGDLDNLKQERQKLRDTLASFDRPEKAMHGITGEIFFDKNGDVLHPFAMGLFKQNRLISAFIQLQAATNFKSIPNLERELEEGRILQIGDRYVYKTNVIHTGIDINEIKNLDEKNSSYLGDFFLWFRYRGNIDAPNIEFINYSTARLNSGESLQLQDPINQRNIDGLRYEVYRVNADFQEKFFFYDYPFDHQELSIGLRHKNLTRERVIYVVDWLGMRDINADEILENWQKYQVFGTITDWDVKTVDFFQDSVLIGSNLGDPSISEQNFEQEYSRFNVAIEIQRDRLVFFVKNLLPLFFFLALSYMILFLPFEIISIEAVSGILLAVVFFH
ncbi:MAG: ABC transporter substrate-binding protein, partial [Cyanobacteria bacterium P01_E01_bin.42]